MSRGCIETLPQSYRRIGVWEGHGADLIVNEFHPWHCLKSFIKGRR